MDVNVVFIVISATIAIGFFSNYFFKKTKIPDIVWLILFGAIIGPGLGIVNPEIIKLYIPIFSAVALLIILFEGGSRINIYRLIRESIVVLIITLSAFFISMVSIAALAHVFFHMPLMISLLLGAIVGGTSSPVVFPLVENMHNVKKEIEIILKMESVITDPLAIIVSLVIMQILLSKPDEMIVYDIVTKLMSMLSISLVLGFFGGVMWGSIWHKFVRYKFHYMLTIGFLFFMYVIVELSGGSGAIASFMVGLALGNMSSIRRMFKIRQTLTGLTKETREFNSYIVFFVRTFFFTLIGILLKLSKLELILYGILISLILLGVRAFVIRMCTYKLHFSEKEKNIMSISYPRGLAAAVLASMPYLQYHISGTEGFTEIVFTVIVTTVFISTLGNVFVEKYAKKGKN